MKTWKEQLTEKATRLTVVVGEFEFEFVAMVTRAPADYDGFGTVTLCSDYYDSNGKEARVVLVKTDALDWQVGRYSSGMFSPEPFTDLDETEVAKILLERMLGKK